VFSVENGAIRVSGTEYGCITTNEEYENYTLEVEFKFGENSYGGRKGAAFDSGVLVHSQGKDGAYNGVWMNSIEVQVIEAGTGDFYVVSGNKNENFSLTSTVAPKTAFKNGGGYFDPEGIETTGYTPEQPIHRLGYDADRKGQGRQGVRNKNEIEKPRGEWNTLKIVAKGGTLDVYLNGQCVNQGTNVKPQKGRIQIQSEGAELYYRRVDLTLQQAATAAAGQLSVQKQARVLLKSGDKPAADYRVEGVPFKPYIEKLRTPPGQVPTFPLQP
jgi:hypothetical protein